MAHDNHRLTDNALGPISNYTRPGRDSELTILLSSAGRRGALVSTLRHGAELSGVSLRLIATDCSELSAAAQLCDAFYLVPRVNDPDFIRAMLQIADTEGPLLVVPTIDPELRVLAESRKLFLDQGSDILVSDIDTIEICSNKSRSSEWLRNNGFAVPTQFHWDQLGDPQALTWPLFYKPKNGSSSIGAHRVDSLVDLALAIQRYGDGVVEEQIVGPEYTVDCWIDSKGRCLAAVPRLRLAVRAGEISKGVTAEFAELEHQAATLCESLPGARGPITVQAIAGPSGLRFIEVNPRFGGGYPLTHQAGGCYTAALIAEARGQIPRPDWFSWRSNVTMLRYEEAVYLEAEQNEGATRGQRR